MSTTIQTTVPAGTYAVDKVHSHVGFAVKHMVVATFRGEFKDYDVTLESTGDAITLEGVVPVSSIAVDDENLEGHLLSPEFFDAERTPEIRFVSTDVRVGDDGELVVDGELTIKGHTQAVEGRGTVTGPGVDIAGNEKLGIELETIIDRTAYGLNWNAPLPKGGFALANDVKLVITLELVKQEA
jgi:polyisoprenoid-binding protein YceI